MGKGDGDKVVVNRDVELSWIMKTIDARTKELQEIINIREEELRGLWNRANELLPDSVVLRSTDKAGVKRYRVMRTVFRRSRGKSAVFARLIKKDGSNGKCCFLLDRDEWELEK